MDVFFDDDDLLEKCNTISDKVSSVYNKNVLKTKRKSHGDEV